MGFCLLIMHIINSEWIAQIRNILHLGSESKFVDDHCKYSVRAEYLSVHAFSQTKRSSEQTVGSQHFQS